jgi:TolB-like protein/cytochrome c-type biogenesis protein CcmH/NrfG
MSESAKAVFLSYARDDAAAARRVAEALRSSGLEVWFDENELRGGDAWDAKIRKQINDCTLFVALISQHTEERAKGYFRLEWKLAVEQTHMLLEGVPFVVPVVIDDTPESEAAVPPEFLRVQWTRLPGALPTPQFVEQVKRLLDAPRRPADARGGAAVGVAGPGPAGAGPAPARSASRWIVSAIAVFAIGAVAYFALRPATKEVPAASPKPVVETNAASVVPAAPVVNAKSIAVLPFANRSPDKENEFFTDGVHEDILTNLFNIRELRVVSRTSVEQYRGTTKSLRQIGTELGVAYILEGSVQRVGNKVHVTGQLIDARTDVHLWAKAYDKDLSDIFVIQAELAKAIATELQAVLSPGEKKLIERKLTENPQAYDLYLQARLASDGSRKGVGQAESLLQSAVGLDPKFAAAWAALCRAHAYAYSFNWDKTPGRLAKAKAAMDAAKRLAPDSPEAIAAMGSFNYLALQDYPRATEQFAELARLQPSEPEWHGGLGTLYRRQGQWLESIASFRKRRELDPNYAGVNTLVQTLDAGRRYAEADEVEKPWLGRHPESWDRDSNIGRRAFYATGSQAEAEKFIRAMTEAQANSRAGIAVQKSWAHLTGNLQECLRLERLRPNEAPADPAADETKSLTLAIMLAASGDQPAARAQLPEVGPLKARLESEPDNDDVWVTLSQVNALLGDKEEALRCAHRAVELVPESLDTWSGPKRSANLAFVYAWTGDKDRAIAEFARLLRTPASGLNVYVMKRSPDYFPLRGDPRFEALLNDPKNNAPLF